MRWFSSDHVRTLRPNVEPPTADLPDRLGAVQVLAGFAARTFPDFLHAGDIRAGGDEVLPERNAGKSEVFVEIGKVIFEGIRNAFSHDLLHDRQVMLRCAGTEDLVRGLALDLLERVTPGFERWRVGIHESPGLDLTARVADELPEMHLLGHVLEQVPVFRLTLPQGLLGMLALGDVATVDIGVSVSGRRGNRNEIRPSAQVHILHDFPACRHGLHTSGKSGSGSGRPTSHVHPWSCIAAGLR